MPFSLGNMYTTSARGIIKVNAVLNLNRLEFCELWKSVRSYWCQLKYAHKKETRLFEFINCSDSFLYKL